MTVAVGFTPRGGSARTGRRGATLEELDWLFGSGVATRRAAFPDHYPVGLSPRLPSRSRSATAQKVRCAHAQQDPSSRLQKTRMMQDLIHRSFYDRSIGPRRRA